MDRGDPRSLVQGKGAGTGTGRQDRLTVRPFALFVCCVCLGLTRALALLVLGASDTLQPSWTSEFQNMSPPMASSPRHRQTVTMTDKRVRQRCKRRSRHRRDGLLICLFNAGCWVMGSD